jgi:nitrogen fixation-related uncharacterized protein
MLFIYILIWGCVVLFGATAVWALVWAIRTGQMSSPEGAASIFDDEEPIGLPTDRFPGANNDSLR